MTRRLAVAALSAAALLLNGCLGGVSLNEAVLGYDHTVSRLEREILLVNIARLGNGLPVHFTVTSSIAATFDYQTNAGIAATFPAEVLNLGVSTAENPTLTIVPIRGQQFTERILTPLEDATVRVPRLPGIAHRYGDASHG